MTEHERTPRALAELDDGVETPRPGAQSQIYDAAEYPSFDRINTRPRLIISGVAMLAVALGFSFAAFGLYRGAGAYRKPPGVEQPSERDQREDTRAWLLYGATGCVVVAGLMATGAVASLRRAAMG